MNAHAFEPKLVILEAKGVSDATYVVYVKPNEGTPAIQWPYKENSAAIGGPGAHVSERSVDEKPLTRRWQGRNKEFRQVPAVHEFGHLLGRKHPGQGLESPGRAGERVGLRVRFSIADGKWNGDEGGILRALASGA